MEKTVKGVVILTKHDALLSVEPNTEYGVEKSRKLNVYRKMETHTVPCTITYELPTPHNK